MGNIFGIGTKKCNFIDYDEVVSLAGAICGHGIPGDLIVEILCKLPVKSLLRFKSVCKPWKLLINSPVFINTHLHRKNPELGGYEAYGYGWNEKEIKVRSNIFPVDIVFIVGTCNGIICLETAILNKPLILVNPSTREFSFLPVEWRGYSYGFYYLQKTREYQVISFINPDARSRNYDISVFTLGKNMTRRDFKDVIAPGEIVSPNGTVSGTSMFWIGFDYDENGGRDDIVIWCDLVEVRFSKMNVPPSPSSLEMYGFLDVLKDSLVMFVYPKIGAVFFDIWMLVDDVSKGKSWTKHRKVGPLFETGIIMKPLEVCWYDRLILCKSIAVHDECIINKLFYYDLETNQVEDYSEVQAHQVEDYKTTEPPILDFVTYVESLVSVSSLVPCIVTDC